MTVWYSSRMDRPSDTEQELCKMLADHMEAGFLENIIDMFRHDSSLYRLVGELITDERVRVRIGATALMEELKRLDSGNISSSFQSLLPLTIHTDPVVRGDVANLLGIIGGAEALSHLERLASDENPSVSMIAKEAIEEITRSDSNQCLPNS